MIKHCSFDPAYSLADLESALGETEGLRGRLVAIGHQAGETIGSFDRSQKRKDSLVILRPGKPLPNPPGPVIDTDTVYVAGQLQEVTTYRGVRVAAEPATQG